MFLVPTNLRNAGLIKLKHIFLAGLLRAYTMQGVLQIFKKRFSVQVFQDYLAAEHI